MTPGAVTPSLHLVQTSGELSLSPAELRLLELLAEGRTTAEIAELLGASAREARARMNAAFATLGARSSMHAVAIGFRRGLLPLDRRGDRN